MHNHPTSAALSRIIRQLMLLMFALLGTAVAEVVPVWSTGAALPGEQIVLYLVDTAIGQDTFTLAEQPRVQNASLQAQQPVVDANPLDPNRAVVEILPILVRPDKAGTLQLENVVVQYRTGRKVTLNVPALQVRSTAEIKWYTTPIPYGALWYTPTQDGYVHQPVRAALKLLMPQDCYAGNLPQLRAVGVKLGTMQLAVQGVAALVHSRLMERPTAFARGQNWRTSDYTGEFTPFREGNSDITGSFIIVRRNGFFIINQEEVPLPTLTLSALPLPPNAPAGFADTVGQYSISAKTTATSLAMNEAVEVEITVRGTGNLQQLACPPPEDAENWKLVPATRKPIISPSGETVGMVFSQLMRPVTEVSGIPSFSLSYFDPSAMAYKRASTAPIPLPWRETDVAGTGLLLTQAATPPPAGTVPVAEMTDIYGYLTPEVATGIHYRLPRWVWYLLYLPAVGIFAFLIVRQIMRRVALRADSRARERELAALAREENGLSFLKRIGAFIEAHIPTAMQSPELRHILQQRDDEAFRPGAAPEVTPQQRTGMLKVVRKALASSAGKAALLLLAVLPLTQAADPAEQLYTARQYTKAQEQLQQSLDKAEGPKAIIYYNLGNCYYRLGKPGYAALNYARALHEAPSLAEARANLSFIQRKEGAILPTRSTADTVFTLLNCSQLWVATVVCTAMLLLGIALLVLLRKHSQPWLTAATALFALLSLLCAADWLYYSTRETPDLSSLPPGDIAYVLQTTAAHTAATEDSAIAVRLPASTPLHLLAKRGSWDYVETTAGTRGWVPAEHVQSLSPDQAPRIPVNIQFY